MNKFTIPLLLTLLFQYGCMDKSGDYSECVDIETARCEFRGRCDKSFDVDQCVYYYKEQCRGRKINEDFANRQLDACIDDIDGLGSTEQCRALDELDGDDNEICTFSELASCQVFLCDKVISGDTDNSQDTDDSEDTDSIPDGLNPQ
jgi:hypothetical protein